MLLLIVSLTRLSAQTDAVKNAIAVFPYQHTEEAGAALTSMQSWDKGGWKSFLSLLDGNDSTQLLKATYALKAYVNHVAGDAEKKKQTAAYLSSALAYLKSFYSRDLVITYLGLLGDDAAVKTLSGLLQNDTYASDAARALAMIHSESAVAALNKGLLIAKEPFHKHIQAALDNANSVLPQIRVAQPEKKIVQNDVQHLLSLQDQMDTAKNFLQKKHILAEAARIPGFPALMFVSQYLIDTTVAADAAIIVARLALADKGARGKAVRAVLEKALPLIKGEDSASLVNNLTAKLSAMPYDNGFVSLFNGKDLTGWKALVGNPLTRAKMTSAELQDQQKAADEKTRGDWIVKDGLLIFTGHGDNLATTAQYSDFDMYADWKITEKGDAGIYLRGTPQVQIWDTSRRDVGAEVGSGGLYNNQKIKANRWW